MGSRGEVNTAIVVIANLGKALVVALGPVSSDWCTFCLDVVSSIILCTALSTLAVHLYSVHVIHLICFIFCVFSCVLHCVLFFFFYSFAFFMILLFSARQHIAYMLSALHAIARPSVCLSVRHTGGSVKNGTLKLGLRNFHHAVAPSL